MTEAFDIDLDASQIAYRDAAVASRWRSSSRTREPSRFTRSSATGPSVTSRSGPCPLSVSARAGAAGLPAGQRERPAAPVRRRSCGDGVSRAGWDGCRPPARDAARALALVVAPERPLDSIGADRARHAVRLVAAARRERAR